MNVWFELKAGKRTINEEGLVREEIEASQLCELTTMQDTLTTLRLFKSQMPEIFNEAVRRLETDLEKKYYET